ncbi:MAG: hypothetical protein K9L02_03835 [Acholeplasmataceae bacterium]|nr:hypothetical protein [Acholeplasmataceae bacterium]
MSSKKYWKKYLEENSNFRKKEQHSTTRIIYINKFEIFKSLICIMLSLFAIGFFVSAYFIDDSLSNYFFGISLLFTLIVEYFYARRIFSTFAHLDGDFGFFIGLFLMFLTSPIVIPAMIIISIRNIISQYMGIMMNDEYNDSDWVE